MRWRPMGHASRPYVHPPLLPPPSLVLGLLTLGTWTLLLSSSAATVTAAAATTDSQPVTTITTLTSTLTTSSSSATNGQTKDPAEIVRRGNKKFSDQCESTEDCGFADSVCDASTKRCVCVPEAPITNHIDKCGKEGAINESCFFNEQCEATTVRTVCRDGRCVCLFELTPLAQSDGTVECIAIQNPTVPVQYVDPAMIGVLVGMALMFIIICVVLRLFSNARWRENRTIFNTPNPRLMNVSLLRESKLLHQDRRNSRGSVRGPSRQPSMASLRPHSPNSQGRLFLGSSRRGSKGSSNASATSLRSNKSPPRHAPMTSAASGATTPMLESVTVEVPHQAHA